MWKQHIRVKTVHWVQYSHRECSVCPALSRCPRSTRNIRMRHGSAWCTSCFLVLAEKWENNSVKCISREGFCLDGHLLHYRVVWWEGEAGWKLNISQGVSNFRVDLEKFQSLKIRAWGKELASDLLKCFNTIFVSSHMYVGRKPLGKGPK